MNATYKAKEDVNLFLNQIGYKNIQIDVGFTKLEKFIYGNFKIKKYIDNSKGVFLFQYPLNNNRYISKKIINFISKQRDMITIGLVHDIEGLRLLDEDESFKKRELSLFNKFDYLIVHNESMKKWILKNGINSEIITLELFDYYSPCDTLDNQIICDITYAGNLQKADFLNKLVLKHHTMEVYGTDIGMNYLNNVSYKGEFSPEELPKHLHSRFGLVWDGVSVDECSGIYGKYLKYNTPHKISLYLSSGMPVIVWKKSAVAKFINDNNLGLCVDNLNNLDKLLDSVSNEDYASMKKNVVEIESKLKSGYFIKEALSKVLEEENK